MKNLKLFIISAVILTAFFACESQKKVSDIIFDKYNGQPGFSMIALPPNFVDKFVDEEQAEQKEFLEQVRDFRLMIFDDEVAGKKDQSVYTEVDKLMDKRNFEDLMSINKDGSRITVKVHQKKDIVREMHVLIKGDEKFFIASLVGRIDLNQISKTIKEFDFDQLGDLRDFTKDFDMDFEDMKGEWGWAF